MEKIQKICYLSYMRKRVGSKSGLIVSISEFRYLLLLSCNMTEILLKRHKTTQIHPDLALYIENMDVFWIKCPWIQCNFLGFVKDVHLNK